MHCFKTMKSWLAQRGSESERSLRAHWSPDLACRLVVVTTDQCCPRKTVCEAEGETAKHTHHKEVYKHAPASDT